MVAKFRQVCQGTGPSRSRLFRHALKRQRLLSRDRQEAVLFYAEQRILQLPLQSADRRLSIVRGMAGWSHDSSCFPESNRWMVNFRVSDLDRMLAQLCDAGIFVEIDPQSYPNGRFARLYDPEGNPSELWQPAQPTPG